MGRDYYGILSIPRSAGAPEVKAGYRTAAMKWHPQKNPGNKVEAEQRFREIAEAYDVLINPLRRKRYDELGERGLKFPSAQSNMEPYQYVGDPFKLFSGFFAESDPLVAPYAQDVEGLAPGISTKEQEKCTEVELPCSLSELGDGATRRVVFERTRLGPNMEPYKEEKLVTLPVRAGWQPGFRVNFRGEGNWTNPSKCPGDLVVIITEKPHPFDAAQEVEEEGAE